MATIQWSKEFDGKWNPIPIKFLRLFLNFSRQLKLCLWPHSINDTSINMSLYTHHKIAIFLNESSSILLHSIMHHHHITRSNMPKTRTHNPWLFSDHYQIPWFLQVFQVGSLPLNFTSPWWPLVRAKHGGMKLRPQETHLNYWLITDHQVSRIGISTSIIHTACNKSTFNLHAT